MRGCHLNSGAHGVGGSSNSHWAGPSASFRQTAGLQRPRRPPAPIPSAQQIISPAAPSREGTSRRCVARLGGLAPQAGRGVVCRGFVGEGASSTAGSYFDSDFAWESRVAEGEAALARQRRERAQQQEKAGWQQSSGGSDSPASASSSSSSSSNLDASPNYDRGSWEAFHSQHGQARFFKERRYLPLEFPQLLTEHPPQHFVEVGCGCGSSLLPVLRANPTCRVTGCDISPTAVRLFLEAAGRYGVAPERVSAFAFDAAQAGSSSAPSSSGDGSHSSSTGSSVCAASDAAAATSGSASSSSPLAGLGADAALLIFTLSALPPGEMPAMLAHALCALRPGGLLLFRDYGLYDMAQLRFPGSQMLGEGLYQRGDGTLAFFFSVEGMAALAREAGFEVVECAYACTALRNRKKGGEPMQRVFVHGVFRRPH